MTKQIGNIGIPKGTYAKEVQVIEGTGVLICAAQPNQDKTY
jgi:hypothetical protein